MRRRGITVYVLCMVTWVWITAAFAADPKVKPSSGTQAREKKEIKYTGFEAKRDPFAVPVDLAKLLERPEKIPGFEEEKPVKMPTIDLQGIIWARGNPQVIVNDSVMQAGDYIGEFEIKEITRNGFILFHKGSEYKINMQGHHNRRR